MDDTFVEKSKKPVLVKHNGETEDKARKRETVDFPS